MQRTREQANVLVQELTVSMRKKSITAFETGMQRIKVQILESYVHDDVLIGR